MVYSVRLPVAPQYMLLERRMHSPNQPMTKRTKSMYRSCNRYILRWGDGDVEMHLSSCWGKLFVGDGLGEVKGGVVSAPPP